MRKIRLLVYRCGSTVSNANPEEGYYPAAYPMASNGALLRVFTGLQDLGSVYHRQTGLGQQDVQHHAVYNTAPGHNV